MIYSFYIEKKATVRMVFVLKCLMSESYATQDSSHYPSFDEEKNSCDGPKNQ